MEEVKSTNDHKIFKKRSGRYAIKDAKGTWINGEKKVEILAAEGLIKVSVAKKQEEEPAAEEAATEETPAETPAE